MKNLNLVFKATLFCCILVSLNTFAQDLQLNESFGLTTSVEQLYKDPQIFSIQWGDRYNNKKIRKTYNCGSSYRFNSQKTRETFRKSYFHGIVNLDIPSNVSVVLDREYCDDWDGLKKTLSNNTQSISDQFLKNFEPITEVKEEIQLESLSSDAKSLNASFKIEDNFVRSRSVTEKLRVAFKLTLDECIDYNGDLIKNSEKDSSDIFSMINNLRSTKFQDYFRCSLKLNNLTVLDRLNSPIDLMNWSTLKYVRFEFLSEHPNQIILLNENIVLQTYLRSGPAINPVIEERALKNLDDFKTAVIDNYGDLLYELSEASDIPESERKEAITAYLETNAQKLKKYLDDIDADLKYLPLMTKISILQSINNTRESIAKIEKQLKLKPSMSLDRTIKRAL